MHKPKVLFLCTGNSARSQMAEAFLRKYGSDKFEAHSAGLTAKGIHTNTIKVMEEAGIDISEQRSKSVSEYLGKESFSYIIPVCQEAEQICPHIFLGFGKLVSWGFEDPAACEGTEEECLIKFREIRDQIEAKVKSWLTELEAETSGKQ